VNPLSAKVILIGKNYFGPAAESFLARQCKAHLKTELENITSGQLKDLAKWVEVGAALLMDQAKASELAHRIAAC
jgi:hypothetical protein